METDMVLDSEQTSSQLDLHYSYSCRNLIQHRIIDKNQKGGPVGESV